MSNESFWKELCMSACFFTTVVVKKCKDAVSVDEKAGTPFWMESCNMLSSAIQLLHQLTDSPRQVALLWSAEMKFVDCLYYVFQMMIDKSTSFEEKTFVCDELRSSDEHACMVCLLVARFFFEINGTPPS